MLISWFVYTQGSVCSVQHARSTRTHERSIGHMGFFRQAKRILLFWSNNLTPLQNIIHNLKYFTSLQIFYHCYWKRQLSFCTPKSQYCQMLASSLILLQLFHEDCYNNGPARSNLQSKRSRSRSHHERKLKLEISRPQALFCITCGRIFCLF